ncbi:MAG: ComF family protein [Kyrpidia sp.]|nr:ComF family protein [Kyrpidia sp.]
MAGGGSGDRRRWREEWLDRFWPPPFNCPFCGRRGSPVEVRLPGLGRRVFADACDRCARELGARIPPPHCPGCGRGVEVPGPCGDCRRRPLALRRVTACSPYRGPVREAIHRVKYQRDERLVELLAGMLAAAWPDLHPPPESVLVSVPMHPEKRKTLGWNHVEVMARGLAAAVGKTAVQALERRGNLQSQTTRGRRDRLTALEGAFAAVGAERIRGLPVVLVDDVLTTGATADACARVLLAAGAREVYGLVVAR